MNELMQREFNLEAINFSQSDGNLLLLGHSFQVKKHLKQIFLQNIDGTGQIDKSVYQFSCESINFHDFPQGYSDKDFENLVYEHTGYIGRCVQYKNTILSFSQSGGLYYSAKQDSWLSFHWKSPQGFSLDDILSQPYPYFMEQAERVWQLEVPKLEKQGDHSFAGSPIEFLCGSEAELRSLTYLAAWALPEFNSIFEHHHTIRVMYLSDNEYWYGRFYFDQKKLPISRRAKLLFDLIFKFNLFTGTLWQYSTSTSGYGYDPYPLWIDVEIPTPSAHERLEAKLKLQNWLAGKLSNEQIRSIFKE